VGGRDSSFDEVSDLGWRQQVCGDFGGATPDCRHYVVSTYDHVFEVICSAYSLTFGEPRS
jgi:hypothetical protein